MDRQLAPSSTVQGIFGVDCQLVLMAPNRLYGPAALFTMSLERCMHIHMLLMMVSLCFTGTHTSTFNRQNLEEKNSKTCPTTVTVSDMLLPTSEPTQCHPFGGWGMPI